MGDSTCVMHAFSYASPIPNEAKQGNPIHALGESISFGRYTSESLAWEKWSSFSNKRYVEEAASYAQPGSVAQKKAFFEAHYKRIAERKAAELLEQANAAENTTSPEPEGGSRDDIARDSQPTSLGSGPDSLINNDALTVIAKEVEDQVDQEVHVAYLVAETEAAVETSMGNGSPEKAATESETSGTTQMEKPLLKKRFGHKQDASTATSKKRPSAYHKTSKFQSSPAKTNIPGHVRKTKPASPMIKKAVSDAPREIRPSPKSLRALINSPSTKEPDKPPAPAKQTLEISGLAHTAVEAPKYCSTPLRTPVQATPSAVSKQPLQTPRMENRRTKIQADPSVSGSKTTGPKWHILSAVSKSLTACRNKLQSPTLSTPFLLRTEERAARRKQKLEEKFNAKQEEKVQLQTKIKEKAETELRKLRQSFCFKARPLPQFYKKNETPKTQINKTPVPLSHPHPQPPPKVKVGRKQNGGSKKQGTTPLPPPLSMIKKDGTKNAFNKAAIHFRHPKSNVTTTAHENTSPNIQHFAVL